MATTVIPAPPTSKPVNYLTNGFTIKSWLLTTDHKRIAILYLISVTAFFFLGGFFAMLIRLELLTPQGDLMHADTYNKVFTAHGMIMVFFFLIPVVPAILGNFLIPLMVGAKDLAFPRINLLSWYLYITAGCMMIHVLLTGGIDTGWTLYSPFSTQFSNTNVIEAGLAIFIAGFSSIFTGLNFIVTVHRMRAPGLTWDRLPLFVWANYATSLIMILGTPVIAITIVMVAVERLFHLGIRPCHVRFGSVAPVAASSHDDVCDHRIARLESACSRDVNRAADLSGVRAREEVAEELDRTPRGDLRGRLGRGEQLDLASFGDGTPGDGLLRQPAELVAAVDPLEFVPVLDQPDPVESTARVDGLAGHGCRKPHVGTGEF